MAELAIASPMLPPQLVLRGGVEEHQQFLGETGFTGGLELHPMRAVRLGRELARSALDKDLSADSLLVSAHQSYVSIAEGMMPHSTVGELVLDAKALVVFPSAAKSLDRIASLQPASPTGTIPVVVYPEIGRSDGYGSLPFADTLFQPNVRVLNKWGVSTTDEMLQRAGEEGLTGIAWDGYHWQRADKSGKHMEKWEEALPRLLENQQLPIKEVHVSIGRNDRTEDDELQRATQDELAIFTDEPERIASTPTGRMLRIIHEANGGNMRYVLEAMPPKHIPHKEWLSKVTSNLHTFLDS